MKRVPSAGTRLWRWLSRASVLTALAFASAAIAAPYLYERVEPAAWAAGPPGEPETISVMSLNIWSNRRMDEELLNAIDRISPDIFCIQELSKRFADRVMQRFGVNYPHRLLHPGNYSGIGIASKLPLTEASLLRLTGNHLPAVTALVQVGSGQVRVVCMHLASPPYPRRNELLSDHYWERYEERSATRILQAGKLLGHLEREILPVLVLGDFNELRSQAGSRLFNEAGFDDSCGGWINRCGGTWPTNSQRWPPVFRIDRIMGRNVEFFDAAVLDVDGSDHYPIVARFRAHH